MRDDVRDNWQHRIPTTKDERVSLTFRSLRYPERAVVLCLPSAVFTAARFDLREAAREHACRRPRSG